MLTAFSRFIGFQQEPNSSSRSVAALERQINELEGDATTSDISRRMNHRTRILAAGGAAGGGLGGYLLSTMSVAVATVAAPVAVAVVGAAAGALTLGIGYRWLADTPKTNHQKAVKNINDLSKNLLRSKIKALAHAKPGSTIDFIFNRLSEVKEEPMKKDGENKPVGLVKLDKSLVKELLTALKALRKKYPAVKIRTIDISSAGLIRRDMLALLRAGLGKYETDHLILSKDNHSEQMISLLREHIVSRKTSFQRLKTLDLSDNDISAMCLNGIQEIVSYLQLKELNLSDNQVLAKKLPIENKAKLNFLLTEINNPLISLRKLNLENTGLVEDQIKDVATFIKHAVFLEEINIDRNEGIDLEGIETEVKENAAIKSVSLKKVITEYDEYLSMDELFADRDEALRKISPSKKANESWPVFLLNYKMAHKSFPTSVAKYLESTVYNREIIDKIVNMVQNQRNEHLGINCQSMFSITENELIAYYECTLPALYQKVKTGKGDLLVDSKLITQMKESKPTQRKSEPFLKEKQKRSVGKKTPIHTKAKPDTGTKQSEPSVVVSPIQVNMTSASITTQYNSARSSHLQSEINEILGADELARNPRLTIPVART